MPYTAITDAVPKIRTALYTALSPVGATYWLQAPEGATLPMLVFQAQDGGGVDESYLDKAGWSGLYTIRALASSPSAAETLLAGVPAAIAGLNVSGYSSRTRFVRSLVLPPEDGIHTAALVYEVELYQ